MWACCSLLLLAKRPLPVLGKLPLGLGRTFNVYIPPPPPPPPPPRQPASQCSLPCVDMLQLAAAGKETLPGQSQVRRSCLFPLQLPSVPPPVPRGQVRYFGALRFSRADPIDNCHIPPPPQGPPPPLPGRGQRGRLSGAALLLLFAL